MYWFRITPTSAQGDGVSRVVSRRLAGHPPDPCPFPSLETRHADGLAEATAHVISLGH